MMKNRDTVSNPYRVPKQPTATWIKVAIAGLLFINLALIAGFVLLMTAKDRCATPCNVTSVKDGIQRRIMFQDDPKGETRKLNAKTKIDETERIETARGGPTPRVGVVEDLEKKVDAFSERLTRFERHLDTTGSRIRSVERLCRDLARPQDYNTVPSITQSSVSSENSDLEELIYIVKDNVAALETRLDKHIVESQQNCADSRHYQYESRCYYVVEARVDQQRSQNLCHITYRQSGILAVIKDNLLQKFIASKLANLNKLYWIGVERDSSRIHHNRTFRYLDGNRVQNDVWEMWMPGHQRKDGRHGCVALQYDNVEEGWYWKDYSCSEQFGYICQYQAVTHLSLMPAN